MRYFYFSYTKCYNKCGDIMEKDILEFELVFLYDIYIKRKLYDNILSSNIIDNDFLIKYQNKLINLIDDIEYKIEKMFLVNFPNNQDIISDIEILFTNMKKRLSNITITNDNLRKFYMDNFSNLENEIINLSHKTFKGYTFFNEKDTQNIIRKCHTVNELLHVAHTLTINNYNLIKKFPSINKSLNNQSLIKLHGNITPLSNEIFKILDTNLDTGDIDIFSLSKTNKVIMMIRDKGHATSLEIDDDNDKLFINYYIPKIINANMVNSLPGVKKINNDSPYTVGSFYLKKDDLPKLNKFIDMIPDDLCASLKGGEIYENFPYENGIIEKTIDEFLITHPNYDKKILLHALNYNKNIHNLFPNNYTNGFINFNDLKNLVYRKVMKEEDMLELYKISNNIEKEHFKK